MLAANPSAVLEACYSEAHVFISDVAAGLSAACVRCVECGRVSPGPIRGDLAAYRPTVPRGARANIHVPILLAPVREFGAPPVV